MLPLLHFKELWMPSTFGHLLYFAIKGHELHGVEWERDVCQVPALSYAMCGGQDVPICLSHTLNVVHEGRDGTSYNPYS